MAEKEYIERGAVVEIVSGYGLANGSTLGRHSGIADVIDERVQAIPAADVAPVVHGEWNLGKSGAVYFCSVCEYVAMPREKREWNYCPNCGAKMRCNNEQEK